MTIANRLLSAPAFLFDLDGTLIDSVYQHVLAWREGAGGDRDRASVWRIHRRIGMSGGLFVNALPREGRRSVNVPSLCSHPRGSVRKDVGQVRPLPGGADCYAI